MMNISEYLFPSVLSVTPSCIRRVLFVGSCVAENAIIHIRRVNPDVHIEFEIFNNALALINKSSDEALNFDCQLLILSLRDVVTDYAVRHLPKATSAEAESIWQTAMDNLEVAIKAGLRHNIEHGMLSFVATFCVPQVAVSSALQLHGSYQDFTALVRALNIKLSEIVRRYSNVYVADVDAIGSVLGKSSFQDDSISFSAHGAFWTARHIEHDTNPIYGAPSRLQPLPNLDEIYIFRDEQFLDAIWRQIEWLFRIVRQIDPVKLVIFDLDDTMWRGQIAENYGDGTAWPQLHGWPVGIWDAVYQLQGRGILTAICSKNDESVVRARWERASHWLKFDDFTFRMVNWSPKAENVATIMQQASVTAKSVVFVDDNPVEREAVRSAFPQIRILGQNPYLTRRVLLWSSETQIATLSVESANRDAMVRAQQQREHARAEMSREEFLSNLGCTVNIRKLTDFNDPQFARSLELRNKTNQFNTTGKRLSSQQATLFLAGGGIFYVFEVEDRFTKYGLVGIVRLENGRFVQFAMSCRVLGLDIESSVVHYIVAAELSAGTQTAFTGEVVSTESNMIARDIYEKAGFIVGENGIFSLRMPPLPPAAHLNFVPPPAKVVSPRGWKFWRFQI